MSCSSIDLKAYCIGETSPREKTMVEDHVRVCGNCREELERLNLTRTALVTLPDEEVPQRIAFVSDKVFEPRWWLAFWRSGPAMGFVSAAVLATAIFVHAFARPQVMPPAPSPIDTAKIEQRIEQEVNARMQIAITRAINDTEARQEKKFASVLDAAEKRYELQRRADLVTVQQTIRYYGQQMGRMIVASNDAAQPGTRP